jgi:hypothetical protein
MEQPSNFIFAAIIKFMKKLIYLTLLLSNLAYAQELKFTSGPALAEKPLDGFTFFNSNQKKGYRIVSKNFSVIQLDDYVKQNGSPKPIKTEVFTGKQKATIEGYHIVNDKNYIIYSIFEKGRDEQVVYMQELSTSMVLLGSPVRMVGFKNAKNRTQVIVVGADNALVNLTDLHIVKSTNNQQIIFVKERDSQLEVKAFSYDKGELWTKNFDLNRDYGFTVTSVKASDNGSVYVSGFYMKGVKKSDPFFLAYSPTLNKHKLHTIKSGDKIDDFGYHVDLIENETPVIAGLYSQKGEAGYKVYKLKDNLELQPVISKSFPQTYYDIIYKGSYKPEYFAVSAIAQTDNKNIVVDIEGGVSTAMKYTSTLYSAPLYIASIGTDGNEKWNTIIQKYQVQPQGESLIGHCLFHKNNRIYLIYNDNINNFDLGPSDKPKDGLLKKNTYIATVEVDENGNARKIKQITTTKDQNSLFEPGEVVKIEKDLFHLTIMKEGKYYFTTLQLN